MDACNIYICIMRCMYIIVMICEICMIMIPYYYHMPYQIKNDFFLELHAYLNLLA